MRPAQRSLDLNVALSVVLGLLAGLTAPSTAAIHVDPMTHIRDDVSRIKVMMESVGEQLERFNSLYLNKLETRLLTSATALAHIDSNVKNVQERAHVWDTFQLHVVAWNEQIKSLDKKLDILSRGAAKWELLDEKMATLLPLEDKVDKLLERLEETDAKVGDIQRKVDALPPPPSPSSASSASSSEPEPPPPPTATGGGVVVVGSEAPLFSEFTGRGVLSTLKEIEIKVNRLAEQDGHAPTPNHSRKVAVVCDTDAKTFELVNDVAGKVDFLVDRLVVGQRSSRPSDDAEHDDYDEPEDYASGSLYSTSNAAASSSNNNGDSSVNQAGCGFLRVWRRMLQPVRRANRRFENLDKVLVSIERLNASQQNSRPELQHQVAAVQEDVVSLLQCCRANDVSIRAVAASVQQLSDNLNARLADQCVDQMDLQQRLQQSQQEILRQVRQSQAELANATRLELVGGACSTLHHRNATGTAYSLDSSAESTGADDQQATHSRAPSADEDAVDEEPEEPPVKVILGCQDLRLGGETESRVYSMASGKELNEGGRDYNTRFCDMTTDGGGWTLIQRRDDLGAPRENFSVGWREYKLGFGHLEREFWFGNDFIHRLTHENDVVLRVELWDFNDTYVYADYESFRVDSEEDLYRLWVEGYQGNATDSLGSHNGYAFSTHDRDNDEAPPCCPCSPAYGGGWWFYSCFEANLNGEYHTDPTGNGYFRGIIWELWRGDYSLRRAEMKIRPRGFQPPPPPTSSDASASADASADADAPADASAVLLEAPLHLHHVVDDDDDDDVADP